VELTNAFVAFICQLKDRGVVSGDQEGKFRPDQNITRSEVVKIVYNTFKFSPQTSCGDFNDVGTENPLYNQITTLKCKGIINGVGDNNFAPNQSMTRAELVKIVMGILTNVKKVNGIDVVSLKTSPYVDVQTDNPFYSFIAMAYEYKIATGFEDKTFKPNEPVTRGATTKVVTLADTI
jgi:5'-nucleotidase/2',3'-cyclic-nucleotide 2'-phosphodiesterase/3'-nucleotidase/5'-nucleotidase